MANVRFNKPTLTRKDMDAVLQTLVDEKIGPGERKREFLKLFAQYVSKRDGLILRSFYDALIFSLKSLSLEKKSKVMISMLSPKIYLSALKALDLVPYFADVDETYKVIKSEEFDEALKEDVKACIFYLPLGSVYEETEKYRESGIKIIEDISESIGSQYRDIKAGMLGDIVISSFEEDGIISTAGGAAVLSDSEEIIENLKSELEKGRRYIELSDMNASLGIVQLSKIEATLSRRSEIYEAFKQSALKGDAELFVANKLDYKPNGFCFPVLIKSDIKEMMDFSSKHDIETKKSFSGCAGMKNMDKFERYPVSIKIINSSLSFPLYPLLKGTDIDIIEKILRHLG